MAEDPFGVESEGPQISVTLKAGPAYKEDMVNFRGTPEELRELFGIPDEEWETAKEKGRKASTLLRRVKLLGDFNRAQHGDAGKA